MMVLITTMMADVRRVSISAAQATGWVTACHSPANPWLRPSWKMTSSGMISIKAR
jgi:hypothetical protein